MPHHPPKRLASFALALFAITIVACSSDDTTPVEPSPWPPADPLTIHAPGFPPMPIPANNPTTKQGVALGRRLYYDPILSADSTQACASCHQFGRVFSESLTTSVGINGKSGPRNAPALVNVGWLSNAFWDGRAATLEAQAFEPVINPDEMAESWDNVVAKLQNHADYPELFGRAFGTSTITKERVVKAIAQFERTFVSNGSKYDRFIQSGFDLAVAGFTPAEERGFLLFSSEKGDCFHCHPLDPLVTDRDFHNIGIDSTLDPPSDPGRQGFTGDPNHLGKFKTPTLRNVELTPPYMHDGRFTTLEEVVNHYNTGGFETETVDPLLRKRGIGLGLTQDEMNDIVAFLKTFTDTAFANRPDLGPP